MEDRWIVEILEKFCNKLLTKCLVKIYLFVHPLVNLEDIFT